MNLLDQTSAWMPVRQHDGTCRWIAPHELSDPCIAAFNAGRADFNGALAQFAIGLLQTALAPHSASAWRASYRQPPEASELAAAFAPHGHAFELDGDGPRFMQDIDLRSDEGEAVGIAGLLIDSPGENTLKNNGDHFVKRGRVQQMCRHCAALALLTLQMNAPSGGRGHRTGLRGGGPLTTLLVAPARSDDSRSLWHTLWLNVQEHGRFEDGAGRTEAHLIFPWLACQSSLQKDEEGSVAPSQVHPLHVFWAMPRRIRLDFDRATEGLCDICGRAGTDLLRGYVSRHHGLNYKGAWRHPLSPYCERDGEWTSQRPKAGGIGYRHWLGWILGMQDGRRHVEAADAVSRCISDEGERRMDTEFQLWAFGFDMDEKKPMKPRCWYEATLPLFSLDGLSAEDRQSLRAEVGSWISAADQAASALRGAVKDAWFTAEARGDFSAVDASFWARTEPAFYGLLHQRIDVARQDADWQAGDAAERWRKVIESAAMDLFDHQFAGAGPVERQNPRRVAQAFHGLRGHLNGAKLRATLQLPPLDAARKTTRKAVGKTTRPKEDRA